MSTSAHIRPVLGPFLGICVCNEFLMRKKIIAKLSLKFVLIKNELISLTVQCQSSVDDDVCLRTANRHPRPPKIERRRKNEFQINKAKCVFNRSLGMCP